MIDDSDLRELLLRDPASSLIAYLKENSSLENIDDLVMIGYGSSSIDIRLFSMKNWGWKRVAENTIETWFFAEKDFQNIQRGLYDILDDEEDPSGQSVWLEIRSRNININKFPLSVFLDGNYSNAVEIVKLK